MHKTIKLGFIFLGLIVLVVCVGNIKHPMLSINKHKIYKEEYLIYVQQAKSNVYNYFYHKYGISAGDLEWEKDYGDGTPIDRLINYCNEKIIENSLVWQEAYERAITNYYTFEDFKKVWEQEMERRKSDHAAGKIVYGPLEMGLREYYDYALSDLKAKVMEAVWADKPYTDEELEAYFEKVKEEDYTRETQIEGIKISALSLEQDKKTALEEVRQVLMDSVDIHQVLRGIEMNEAFEITKITFDDENSRIGVMKEPQIRETLLQMSVGEVSQIFVNDTSMDIILVTHIKEGEYYSFEEMKGGIEQRCKEQVMKTYMEEKLKQAEKEINYSFIKKSILEGF